MKPRTQIIISACLALAFAFIALNRWITHQPAWAAWAVLALAHFVMLIVAIRSRANAGGGSDA